jgi:hypothetical protein
MHAAIEKTVTSLYQTSQLTHPESISLEILESIEEIVADASISKMVAEKFDSNFNGMVMIKIYPEGDMKCMTPCKQDISEEDRKKISAWLKMDDHRIYANGYYRLDLDNYIFMFKIYRFNKNKLLLGHVLENTIKTKMKLMEARQNFIMRNFNVRA